MDKDELVTIFDTTNYTVYVCPEITGISKESHYAVYNKKFKVVEYRTANLMGAMVFHQEAEEYFSMQFSDHKNVSFTPDIEKWSSETNKH